MEEKNVLIEVKDETVLLEAALSFLNGSVAWKWWCGVSLMLGLANVVAFIVIIEVDWSKRFLCGVCFAFLASGVTWLSMMTSDKRKKDLCDTYVQIVGSCGASFPFRVCTRNQGSFSNHWKSES